MYRVKFIKLQTNAIKPEANTKEDACFDLFSVESKIILPGQTSLVATGICIELPKNTEAQIRPRSGLALNHSITVLNSPGTIDEGYRGEIGVILINHGTRNFQVDCGMRIAQIVVKPIFRTSFILTNKLSKSSRGKKGFGSSGYFEKE